MGITLIVGFFFIGITSKLPAKEEDKGKSYFALIIQESLIYLVAISMFLLTGYIYTLFM